MAVLLYHAIDHRPDPPVSTWFRPVYSILMHGHLGVPLFFVISGFCIHLRWAKNAAKSGTEHKLDFASFWKRRLHRLYPPYFVALCLTMLLVLAAYFLHKDFPILTLYPNPRLRWIGIDFIFHVTMLHGLHPILDRAGGNPVYWTLAREEYFYLMYFGLLAWRRRWGMLSSLVMVFVTGLIFSVAGPLVLSVNSRW